MSSQFGDQSPHETTERRMINESAPNTAAAQAGPACQSACRLHPALRLVGGRWLRAGGRR